MNQKRTTNRYQVLKESGLDDFYRVPCANNIMARRLTALKTLYPKPSAHPVLVEEFNPDATLAERTDHPHVVSILEIGRIENQHFSSMVYLPQNLAGEFESDRQIDIEILIGLASLVPEGLSTSHGRKEIHFLSISDQITMTNRSIIVY